MEPDDLRFSYDAVAKSYAKQFFGELSRDGAGAGFRVDQALQREPYDFEAQTPRLYVAAAKAKQPRPILRPGGSGRRPLR